MDNLIKKALILVSFVTNGLIATSCIQADEDKKEQELNAYKHQKTLYGYAMSGTHTSECYKTTDTNQAFEYQGVVVNVYAGNAESMQLDTICSKEKYRVMGFKINPVFEAKIAAEQQAAASEDLLIKNHKKMGFGL